MKNDKLKMLSEIYKSASTKIIITDDTLTPIWTNNKTIFQSLNSLNLSNFIKNSGDLPLPNNFITPCTINNINYTAKFIVLYLEEEIDGYIIELFDLNDIINLQNNKDFSELILSDFSCLRLHVSDIINCANSLATVLEKNELYDELSQLNKLINHCYNILSNMLNRSEIAKYYLNCHTIVKLNVSRFLEDLQKISIAFLRTMKIDIDVVCDEDVLIEVDVDRFVMMILNLLVNSIKNNIEEEKRVTIKLKTAENYVILTISDNGLGIDAQNFINLFKLTTTPVNTSSGCKQPGYGLIVLNEFCKAFNATPIVTTTEDIGTSISIRIPLCTDENKEDYLESKTSDYFTNRFSAVFIKLTELMDVKFY